MNDLQTISMINDNKLTPTFTAEDLEAYKYTFGKKGAITPPLNYYRNIKRNSRTKSMKHIKSFAPGLYMIGELDKYISIDTAPPTIEMYKNLQFAQIKGSNHFAQQDTPDQVNEIIDDFLNFN